MKLSKNPIKKPNMFTSEKKRPIPSRSSENIKNLEYTTVQKEDESNLFQMALEEYKDLFPEILLLSKKDFFESLERYIQISLATSDKIFPKGALKKILNLIAKKYYNEEMNKIEKNLKTTNFKEQNTEKINFVPHCKYTKEFIHSCGEKLFILEKQYCYCVKCKLIYKPDCILLKCDKCNTNYYTEIEEKENTKEKKDNYKPATWAKYHCNALINDTMKCQKCQNCLYLNINNGSNTLYCLKCNLKLNPYEISWKCVLCNSAFFSEPKIYNKYELKSMLIAIKNALFKGIEAKPKYLPCCKIYGDKVKEYKYLHKNECTGFLYEGELNGKKIIVCSKCHMLNYYENQFWFCPICKVRFRLQIKNNYKIKSNSECNSTEKYQNMETIDNYNNKENKKEIYQKRKNNISIEIKRNIFNICQEKDDQENNVMDKLNNIGPNTTKKKMFSVRNHQKKLNLYKSYYLKSKDIRTVDNIENNEHSHIIYSKLKKNGNDKKINEFKNSLLLMTNFKELKKENEDNNKILNNIFNKSNNKLKSEISRNISSNIKNVRKAYPSQVLNIGITPSETIQNSNSKKNYVSFLKRKQPTIFHHVKVKSSGDQSLILQTCENINENKNNNRNKIMRFERMISQDEINSNNNNIFKDNKLLFSKNKKQRISINENNKKEKEIKLLLKDNDNILKEIEKVRKENKNKMICSIVTDINKNRNFNSDDYNIIRQIGQGSFGKIFEVEDKYHRHFALKKIIAYSFKEVEIIKAEYNILYSLQNLEIDLIGIYGIETRKLDRTTYAINVLMELAVCDWEQEIKKRNAIKNYYTEKELIIILKKLVKTFSHLQKANVSHRDIKPQNILVCSGNNNLNLKIADFGEAKKIINKNGNDNNTIKQTIRGTELYMSPILFNSLRNKMIYKYTKHNTYKSDVFSLGYCILLASTLSYKLLCEIREIKTMNEIKKIVEVYINRGIGFYSKKYWNIIFTMLELDEKNRPDFIELEKIVEEL